MNPNARIMPRDRGAASLDIVIAVMAFLAALALGASLIAERAAATWRTGLAGRITIQVSPPEKSTASLDQEIQAALSTVRSTPGIAHATLLSEQDTLTLIKPWLGSDALIAGLPIPRLIDAEIMPGASLDVPRLRARLKVAAPDSIVDDHTHWLSRLRALADGITWSAYGVLALIALATAATVSFATRAGLETHREIVELLHQIGAHSGFIARAFEWHYFIAALIASIVGAGVAALLFVVGTGAELAGVEAIPFLPPVAMHLSEIGWLLTVPVAASWIALLTARISVLGALSRIY
jgi:cell division transport system permease protein